MSFTRIQIAFLVFVMSLDLTLRSIDGHHGHIVTGELKIKKNIKLRNLISKGPKYREPVKVDFDCARACIEDSMDDFINNIAIVKKVNKLVFPVGN